MNRKTHSSKKTGAKGRSSKAAQIDAEAEAFKAAAVAYAKKAHDAALAHFEATDGKASTPFLYEPLEAGPQEFEDYHTSGLFFAHVLSAKGCPEQFRKLFGAIFAEDMLGPASNKLTWPGALPFMYAVVRDILDARGLCGTAEGLHDALIKAVEIMVPAEIADAARASLKGE
jgi:hypothetical protein